MSRWFESNTNSSIAERRKPLNSDPQSTERLRTECPWQQMFPKEIVDLASQEGTWKKIQHLDSVGWGYGGSREGRYYPDDAELKEITGKAPARNGRRYSYGYSYNADADGLYRDFDGKAYFAVKTSKVPVSLGDQWDSSWLSCSCKKSGSGKLCLHEAALLAAISQETGGRFVVVENQQEWQKRQRQLVDQKNETERAKFGEEPVPALSFFQNRRDKRGIHIYDMRGALKERTTDAWNMTKAKELMAGSRKRDLYDVNVKEFKDRSGRRHLYGALVVKDEIVEERFPAARAVLEGNQLRIEAAEDFLDSEQRLPEDFYNFFYREKATVENFGDGGSFLNAHALVLCSALWDFSDELVSKEKDLTDEKAEKFFKSLEKAGEVSEQKAELPEEPRKKAVALYPRIIIDNGEAALSFRIEQAGSKAMIVKNMRELVGSYTDRTVLTLSKKESIDFGKVEFTADSEPLYDFIQRRIGEVHDANSKFESRNSTGYYGYHSVRTINVTSSFELKGALLDGFYDTWQNHTVEYTDKTNDIKAVEIPVGHKPLRFALTARKIADARGALAGVAVDGLLPVLLRGTGAHRYTLNARGLSRITEEERNQIRPFDAISDASGYFRFQVGMEHIQEFYYRVVPTLLENPVVQFRDECEDEVQSHLPPEPQFDFWLDCEDLPAEDAARRKGKEYRLSLRAEVGYDDGKGQPVRRYTMGVNSASQGYRDTDQETRVEKVIRRYLPARASGRYTADISDDEFFDFLRGGVSVLERFGTVHGTDAFRTHSVRPVPQVKFGVSVESGIMDLSLTSKDLSVEELQGVLESYRRRKRFYRLKSGDYLDLTADSQIAEIGDMLTGLDLTPEEVIRKSAKLPLYRALYLDKLLEAHENIASSRDRIYRALIRNFHTVKDSEIEPPAELENVLRPYQTYGFKWIRTLQNAGFSGILADEMGLGKTLQMIAVLQSDYAEKAAPAPVHPAADGAGRTAALIQEAGSEGKPLPPSLIVCPASLVYNWQEEFGKFAPAMCVVPIAGGAAMRRKAWEAWNTTQVYIISYDLLKRHIAEVSEKSFYYVVLDEAQYIKNAGAAVSKSVKALKAQYRFALTGTPIENRLSELWSIFDFLMPGFLFSHKDFEQKLEVPITKNKDEDATKKLKDMTSPFILRRRKEDVLQDLPDKLEEVRYVPISGEQQKLYDAQVLRIKGAINDSDEAGGRVKVFAELTRIREICCDPSLIFEDYHGESAKREACLGLIRQAMDGGHRMLVFSQFTSMLALLEKDLQEEGIPYYLLTGATSKEKRIQLVHAFNEGDTPVFLISLKAGGTGLNLTGADVVIHYDPWWNLAAQNQATDRAHRIGQTKQVTVYRLIMKGTIEERILDLQNAKRDLAESVLEGDTRSLSSLSKEELLELLE